MSDEPEVILPLPLRVLFLLVLGLLAWYTNIHLLKTIGIDPNDFLWHRTAPSIDSPINQSPRLLPVLSPRTDQSTLPLILDWKAGYRVAVYWSILLVCGIGAYLQWPQHPPIHNSVYLLLALLPFIKIPARLHIPFLMPILRKLNHISFSQLRHYPTPKPKIHLVAKVTFLDVLIFDILTSFAKVGGDIWDGMYGWITTFNFLATFHGDPQDVAGWGKCFVVSLPYLCRLRHCLSECYTASSPLTRKRSSLNALKYFSSFPVIILSTVMGRHSDPFDPTQEITSQNTVSRLPNNSLTFRLWLLAVIINSLYSFWWDVTNDWGLQLLLPNNWKQVFTDSLNKFYRPSHLQTRNGFDDGESTHHRFGSLHNIQPVLLGKRAEPHDITPRYQHRSSASAPSLVTFKSPSNLPNQLLRPLLVLRDPLVYCSVIILDFMLRITWSIKLSVHLHHVSEIESGIFLLEILEILRRWVWIFFRVEWEWVKKSASQSGQPEYTTETQMLSMDSGIED